MLALSVILALAAPAPPAAPPSTPPPTAAPAGPRKILVLPVQAVGTDADIAKTVTSLLAVSLSRRADLDVTSVDDARALLDAEANKQLLGGPCSESTCLAELAGAMGAELVAYGEVAQLDKTFVVTLNVFDARAGRAVGRDIVRTESRGALPDLVAASVNKLLPGGAPPSAPAGKAGLGPVLLWGGVGVGAVGAALAGTGALLDGGAVEVLQDPASSRADKDGALGTRTLSLVSFVGGLGAVAVGAGLVGASFIVE